MTSLILVTGGTGTLGKLVVPRLREAGAKVRVLSRQAREADGDVEFVRGDLDTGAGIDAAVAGAEVIVHCAGSQKKVTGTRPAPCSRRRPGPGHRTW